MCIRDRPGRGHGSQSGPVGERKGKIEAGCAIHMNGVQSGVGTHHAQVAVFRNQKNVRYVAAVSLVKMAPLLRQVHGFTAGNILEVDDCVGDAALRSNDQPLQVGGLLRFRITNLRIFGDGEIEGMRNWPRPFHRAGNGSAVDDGNDFVIALRKGRGNSGQEREQDQ